MVNRYLPREQDHRQPILLCRRNSCDRIEHTGPRRDENHAGSTGGQGLSRSGVDRQRLMLTLDDLDTTLVQPVEDRRDRPSWNSEDPSAPPTVQDLDETFRHAGAARTLIDVLMNHETSPDQVRRTGQTDPHHHTQGAATTGLHTCLMAGSGLAELRTHGGGQVRVVVVPDDVVAPRQST